MTNKNSRKIWFITRPERDPAFHEEALQALSSVTDNFQIKWRKNRELHKKYEQALIDINIKRNSISNDGSGGRTWAALLKTFGYCYTNNKGYLVPTKVALEILKGNKVFENIKKQILTLQIPNSYFLESGFRPKYDDNFAILPARFLIRLCTSSKLSYYVTKEEITFIVITTQKENEFNSVIDKIIKFRNMNIKEKEDFKTLFKLNFEHRERSDKAAREFSQTCSDVAHTFMLICEYTGLVKYDRGINSKIYIDFDDINDVQEQLRKYDIRYPFNTRYLFSLERMAEVNGLDVDSYKASRYGDIKPVTNTSKKLKKAEKLLGTHPNVSSLTSAEIVNILSSSFSVTEAKKISQYILSNNSFLKNIDADFVKEILDEDNNLEFENKVGKILQQFGFEIFMHPKVNDTKTEIDILLKYDTNFCGIIDAKNYKQKFSLSASLASHMASEYIPNYLNYQNRELKFFGYVTCNDIGGKINLNKITNKILDTNNIEIKGLMINVKTLLTLLDYCIENNFDSAKRVEIFLSLINNNSYTSPYEVLEKI